MQVKIKKLHPDAVIPSYSKKGDAGLDLTAISHYVDDITGNDVYGTGLAIEIPQGYVGLIFPRSSNSKTEQMLTNHVGVIDSGYRGEILFQYRNLRGYVAKNDLLPRKAKTLPTHQIGDRIGQLIIIPYPQIEFEEVDELSLTERGNNGFGSTGNK